jgi:hypothetical protein
MNADEPSAANGRNQKVKRPSKSRIIVNYPKTL